MGAQTMINIFLNSKGEFKRKNPIFLAFGDLENTEQCSHKHQTFYTSLSTVVFQKSQPIRKNAGKCDDLEIILNYIFLLNLWYLNC